MDSLGTVNQQIKLPEIQINRKTENSPIPSESPLEKNNLSFSHAMTHSHQKTTLNSTMTVPSKSGSPANKFKVMNISKPDFLNTSLLKAGKGRTTLNAT